METGTITFRQFLLPWNERKAGAPALLRAAADEVAALGPITIMDLALQGLPYWQGESYLQESLFFTYREDDLVTDPAAGTVSTHMSEQSGMTQITVEVSNTGGAYDYAALLHTAAEQLEARAQTSLMGLYFDHRVVDDQYQYPFIVLMLAKV